MGKPRVVPGRLTPLLLAAALAGCGGDAPLLVTSDVQEVVYGSGAAAGSYAVRSMDPALRGSIRGAVTFDGTAPKSRPHDMTDAYCIGAHSGGLLREELVVGASGGIRDVIVYVKRGATGQKWPVPTETVVLDQKGCQYVPHVAVVQTGQPLVIKSSDPINHNVHAQDGPNGGFNRPMTGVGSLDAVTFLKTEMPPKQIICDVHGWMKSFVAVLPHPLHAVTAEDGTYAIQGVPPGKYELAFWHEKLGERTVEVEVGNSQTVTADLKMGGSS
jgi:hypothetical protein